MSYGAESSKKENPTNGGQLTKGEGTDVSSSISQQLEYVFGQSLGKILEEQATKIKLIEMKVKSPMRKHFMGEVINGVWVPKFPLKSYKRAELIFQLRNLKEAYELVKAIREENERIKEEQKSLEAYDTFKGGYLITAIAVLFDDPYKTFLYINFNPKKRVYFITYLCEKWPTEGVPPFHVEMEKRFKKAGYTKIEDREEIHKRVKMYLPDESFIYFR
ncbi:MAG: hypothetical protein Q6367_000905 [Candidatus Freyarchaeota archaeon]